VSVSATNDWQANSSGTAESAVPGVRALPRHKKLEVLRDTLIALGMQLSFRISMFLRHLNY